MKSTGKTAAIAGIIAIGTGALLLNRSPDPQAEAPPVVVQNQKPDNVPHPETPEPTVETTPPPASLRAEAPVTNAVVATSEETPAPQQTTQEQRLEQYRRYYEQVSQRYTGKMNLLANETDPHKRGALIRQIAPYVRMDTLATLDWVRTLETAEEQRIALAAINRHALVGIGARIEKDETGLPAIRGTTIMSAVESTGAVMHGDHIAGIVQPDGSLLNFYDLSMREIVGHLRGKPGTEVELMMSRTPDGTPSPKSSPSKSPAP